MAARTPTLMYQLASDVGALVTFPVRQGAVYLRNAGPNIAFLAFDALPAAASVGNGRFALRVNEALNLEDIEYTSVGLLCAAGQTAGVDVIGLVRPGV